MALVPCDARRSHPQHSTISGIVSSAQPSILYICQNAIGDIITTLPSIHFLRQLHPGGKLDVCVSADYADIFAGGRQRKLRDSHTEGVVLSKGKNSGDFNKKAAGVSRLLRCRCGQHVYCADSRVDRASPAPQGCWHRLRGDNRRLRSAAPLGELAGVDDRRQECIGLFWRHCPVVCDRLRDEPSCPLCYRGGARTSKSVAGTAEPRQPPYSGFEPRCGEFNETVADAEV